jgi:glycosyltransferase involved in cell wall biosynthesis
MALKVLIASMNRQFAGGERYVTILAKALDRSGYNVSFFGDWLEQFSDCRFSQVTKATGNILKVSSFPQTDVLILNGVRPLYKHFIARLLNGRKSRLTVYVHHMDVSDPHRGNVVARLRPLLLFVALRFVHEIVTINNAPLGFPFRHRAQRTILNAVDANDYECLPFVERTTFNLLCVGSLTYRKNFQLALRALVYVPDALLTIVGSGPELEPLVAMAKSLGVSDRVRFVGQVNDVRKYYAQSDALLMPSLQEAFGLVAIEAMASCLPVISTPTDGGKEIIGPDNAGILLTGYTPEEMAQAIGHLRTAELRQQLALSGRRRVIEKFSANRFASEWSNLLTNCSTL